MCLLVALVAAYPDTSPFENIEDLPEIEIESAGPTLERVRRYAQWGRGWGGYGGGYGGWGRQGGWGGGWGRRGGWGGGWGRRGGWY